MEVLYQGKPFELREITGGYTARLKLPFVQDKDFTVNKYGDELVVSIGNQKGNNQ
ncbi:hypothetical protein [Phaeodactylibacter sp.]|uniref:hypothetical protein n=1 Tax=Phaeodactylibacter sp. TaxID=1940289 RepID=UPI0032EC86CB